VRIGVRVRRDPAAADRHRRAHPYDLEEVTPVIKWDISRYKTIEEMDVLGTLDGRLNLLDMKPNEFEHLVRRLFEAMGFEAWTTQALRDDGVDAVARNETS
jgi:restriction system protein